MSGGCTCLELRDVGIGGTQYAYNYHADTADMNGRTISAFSTDVGQKMRKDCKGCSYRDFSYFYYYGTDDYAHEWVLAAFAKMNTDFDNGNAGLSSYGNDGRREVIQKGWLT